MPVTHADVCERGDQCSSRQAGATPEHILWAPAWKMHLCELCRSTLTDTELHGLGRQPEGLQAASEEALAALRRRQLAIMGIIAESAYVSHQASGKVALVSIKTTVTFPPAGGGLVIMREATGVLRALPGAWTCFIQNDCAVSVLRTAG